MYIAIKIALSIIAVSFVLNSAIIYWWFPDE